MRFHFYFKIISMPRGNRRKIEVPRDTQSQLGDAGEDIEIMRREREERDERGLNRRRGTERG